MNPDIAILTVYTHACCMYMYMHVMYYSLTFRQWKQLTRRYSSIAGQESPGVGAEGPVRTTPTTTAAQGVSREGTAVGEVREGTVSEGLGASGKYLGQHQLVRGPGNRNQSI